MKLPYFSIIIPAYNRAWSLERTLPLVLAQDFDDFEVMVVDDGSTDGTEVLVKQLAAKAKNEGRVQYIFQKNGGQASARQTGLEAASGEWVTYVDSDDELYPHYLSAARRYFKAHSKVKYAMAYMDRTLELHDAQHRVLQAIQEPATTQNLAAVSLKSYAHWKIKPCGTGIFHRRDAVTDAIAWDTSLKLMEDIDFMFQFGLAYPDGFGFIAEPLFHQRQAFANDGVCSGASYGDWADGFEKLFQKYEDAWFMEGQDWYPAKVEKYRERQRLFEEGRVKPPSLRYF